MDEEYKKALDKVETLEKELEIMVPSEHVRNYIKETRWDFKDREKASLLVN